MRPRSCGVLLLLPALGVLLYSQDSAQEDSLPSSSPVSLCDPDHLEPGSPLEVLSDTSGIDLRQYLWEVVRNIRINWRKSIAAEARLASDDKGCATLEFSIERDGKFAGMKLVQSSGNAVLERAAWAGIIGSSPFHPVPEQFRGDSLALRFHFRYNPSQRGHLMPDGLAAVSGSSVIEAKNYRGEPIYRVGDGVTAPKEIYAPGPEYAERARKKKLQGTVVIEMIVTPEGNVDELKIVQGFDTDMDQKALETVRQWRFDPGTKDGKPVAVQLNVEVALSCINLPCASPQRFAFGSANLPPLKHRLL